MLGGLDDVMSCLCVGPEAVEAQCQRLQIRNKDGDRVLFAAGEDELLMTTEKFTVTGKLGQHGTVTEHESVLNDGSECLRKGSEGAVFGHSVETPLIQARSSEDLK